MKKKFASTWISSTQVRKQRKYRFNAPLHIRSNFLNSHLSKQLREKYHMRSIRVRREDKVKVLKGKFAKLEGTVEAVDVKKCKVYVTGADNQKKDGSKTKYPIDPSNLLILELYTDDKKRFETAKKEPSKETTKKETKGKTK